MPPYRKGPTYDGGKSWWRRDFFTRHFTPAIVALKKDGTTLARGVSGSGLLDGLALSESHFTMRGRNRCDLNSAWATGVAYARFLNLHQRHGDLLKIANLGDFCGTRWQTNVIMIPTPGGKSYLMPLGKVMALYRKHTGHQSVRVTGTAPDIDVVASRTNGQFFLQVVNTHRTRAQSCRFAVEGFTLKSGKAFEIATDPQAEITAFENDLMPVREKAVVLLEPYVFPAASVTALELTTRRA